MSGDLGGYRPLNVPMTQMIQSGTFYHSSGDVYEEVPAEGLERAARFHAFFIEQATRVMDLWLTVYFVLSGYLIPVDLFPPAARVAIDFLPFRYQIGLPVELMVGAHGRADALSLVGRQWIFVLVTALIVHVLWRRGLARFAAYGG